jgi:hypothetical protein
VEAVDAHAQVEPGVGGPEVAFEAARQDTGTERRRGLQCRCEVAALKERRALIRCGDPSPQDIERREWHPAAQMLIG